MTWKVLIGVGTALAVGWLALAAFLLLARPAGGVFKESLRILPDTLRLLHRLATDRATPWRIRARLGLLLAYLAMPVDVIPDFLPGIGYADDVVIVAATLRSVVRRAGPEAVAAHWPGTRDGLAALWRLVGVKGPAAAPADGATADPPA